MKKKLIGISLIVLFVVAAGCMGDQGLDDTNQNSGIPDNLTSEVKDSIESKTSYNYEMILLNSFNYTEVGNQSNKANNELELSLKVKHNMEEPKISLNNSYSLTTNGEETSQTQLIYAKDDLLFQQQFNKWVKLNMTNLGQKEQFWESQKRLSTFTKILNSSTISQESIQTINETKYIKLTIDTNNKTEVWENVYEPTGINAQLTSGFNISVEENLDNIEASLWIYEDSLEPAKIKSSGKISNLKRSFTEDQEEVTYDYTMDYQLEINYDFNNTEFNIPDKVLNATGVST